MQHLLLSLTKSAVEWAERPACCWSSWKPIPWYRCTCFWPLRSGKLLSLTLIDPAGFAPGWLFITKNICLLINLLFPCFPDSQMVFLQYCLVCVPEIEIFGRITFSVEKMELLLLMSGMEMETGGLWPEKWILFLDERFYFLLDDGISVNAVSTQGFSATSTDRPHVIPSFLQTFIMCRHEPAWLKHLLWQVNRTNKLIFTVRCVRILYMAA